MARFHATAKLSLVLMMMMSGSVTSMKFASLPDVYTFYSTYGTSIGTASSAQECVDLVAAAAPAVLAVTFSGTDGACYYFTRINGYIRQAGGSEPATYLRTDNVTKSLSAGDCLTNQDAEYLLDSEVDLRRRASTYDAASGLCISENSENKYLYANLGMYAAGGLRDDALYRLSRDKAMESVEYDCADEKVIVKMIFGGSWYCYETINVAITTASIKDNLCAAVLGSGSGPVKITEAREYGFIHNTLWALDISPFIGLYLKSGTTYVWYDGSAATGVPWKGGGPNGDPGQDLVYASSTYGAYEGSGSGNLTCKTPARYVGYDSTMQFT